MKKIGFIIIITIAVAFALIKFGVFFVMNCYGDVCYGPKKLVYILAKNDTLCSLVSGQYESEPNGWGGKQTTCAVNSNWLCYLRGGKFNITYPEMSELGLAQNFNYCGKK